MFAIQLKYIHLKIISVHRTKGQVLPLQQKLQVVCNTTIQRPNHAASLPLPLPLSLPLPLDGALSPPTSVAVLLGLHIMNENVLVNNMTKQEQIRKSET